MGKVADAEKSKKVRKKDILPTKVVVRRLPAGLTEEEFRNELGDIPDYDFFSFHGPDYSLETACFARAYINFLNYSDMHVFKSKFDYHMFISSNGIESPAVVEVAQFQGVPRPQSKRRRDPRCGTIESDTDYMAFIESLQKEKEPVQSAESYLEQLEARKAEAKAAKEVTPLLEFLKARRAARNANKHGSNDKRTRREYDGEKDGRPSRKKGDDTKKPGKKSGNAKPTQTEKPHKEGKKSGDGSSAKQGAKKGGEKHGAPERDQERPTSSKSKSPRKYSNKSSRSTTGKNTPTDREKGDSERSSSARPASSGGKPRPSENERMSSGQAGSSKETPQESRPSKDSSDASPRDKTKRKNRDRPEIAIYRPPSRPSSGSGRGKDGRTKERPAHKDKERHKPNPAD